LALRLSRGSEHPAAQRPDAEVQVPESSLVYFQFVFAAITPILFIAACSAGSA